MSALIGSLTVAGRQDQQPLDVVAQLADVARPGMDLQHGDRVVAQPAPGQALRRLQGVDEIVDQFGDILAPLRQGRHADRHDVQAVEQVLAEPALGDLDLAGRARWR